ncbi:hypothetical protein ABJI51_24875 [Amycolatopsis sp. NEAU-NG30]|uniref:Uncharacterized protein n=1 Tax=Amycolatopsis melonis TaxID=3156488 RepID=A0ABV0LJ53_9PSEU
MTAKRFGHIRQVILLCALAFCVVAMHHVSPASGMPDTPASAVSVSAMQAPAHSDGHGDGMHDVLHLCLAVLGALLVALVALLVLPIFGTLLFRAPGPRGSPRPGRPPDRTGHTILTSLCVLRT